jgi:quinol monooxygenase YgiN
MLEEFKQQAAKCISIAKEKDPGTLQYDWFISSDKTECEIREAYESSEATPSSHIQPSRGIADTF